MKNFWLFLFGLGASLQVRFIASASFSEFFAFAAAPFIFMADFQRLRQHRFLTAIMLSLFVMMGCFIGAMYNHSDSYALLTGIATPYAVFSIMVVLHRMLEHNLAGFKWLLVGMALSFIVNIFIFQNTTESMMYAEGQRGLAAVEGIMSSPIFWIGRINTVATLPIRAWYLQTPLLYSALAPVAMVAFALLSSVSGRSAALCSFLTVLLVCVGRKQVDKMLSIARNFPVYLVLGMALLFIFGTGYKYAAKRGLLGDKAREKYLAQTHGKDSFLALLIGGRVEFFVGMYAGVRNPIIGYGPKPLDNKRYMEQFLEKYGNEEDAREYAERLSSIERRFGSFRPTLPAHSHIGMYWNWYGIMGLVFWLYVLYIFYILFRKGYVAVVPQWYGYFAVMLPGTLWGIFFSPFSGRVSMSLIISMALFARAIGRGWMQMPYDVYRESFKAR